MFHCAKAPAVFVLWSLLRDNYSVMSAVHMHNFESISVAEELDSLPQYTLGATKVHRACSQDFLKGGNV